MTKTQEPTKIRELATIQESNYDYKPLLPLDKRVRHDPSLRLGGIEDEEFDSVREEEPILYSAGKPYSIRVEAGERRVVRLR